jgi:hypothetical protein
MTRRQRIQAWIKADAQRQADAAVIAQVTAKLRHGQRPKISLDAASVAWAKALHAEISKQPMTLLGRMRAALP